ncbi:MAG: GNAT family N-acetyltransferase, partial [Armatimonadota bacterium]
MQIRDVRDDEIDELIDHMDLVFNTPRERMEMAYRHDSTVRLHQVKVAVEDGRIVSAVRVANRPVRIGEIRVEIGGIGGVSTHPDYRGRGYCTALLEAQIEYMQQQEYDISMLFTGIVGFYRRLGWYSFPEHSATVPVPDTSNVDSESPYT